PLTYSWDFGDGSTGGGVRPTHAFADNGIYTVTLTVSDGQATSTDTMTVTVRNVAPTAAASGPATAVAGQTRTWTFAASDPSSADAAKPFSYRIDWGDGTTATATGPAGGVSVAHAFAATGSVTVRAWATDKDGAEGPAASLAVTVKAAELQNG